MIFDEKNSNYSMLEEIRVQILVESVFKLDATLSPIDFVTERYLRVWHELHFVLARQINVDDLLSVVTNVQLLVRPYVIRNYSVVLFWLSHNSCNFLRTQKLFAYSQSPRRFLLSTIQPKFEISQCDRLLFIGEFWVSMWPKFNLKIILISKSNSNWKLRK